MPHLGIFFGKKLPKNPKKPNRKRDYYQIQIASKAAARQLCFAFWQNISGFIVSLQNLSKRREGLLSRRGQL